MALATLDEDTTTLPATLDVARSGLAAHPFNEAPVSTSLAIYSAGYVQQMANTRLGFTDAHGARQLWTVSKQPLSGPDGEVWPGAYGTQRDDNGERLGVVGSRYVPLQSHHVAEALEQSFAHLPREFRPKVERAGTLGGSGRVYTQLTLPPELSELLAVPKDRASANGAYLTHTNTHDGSTTSILGATCVRIVCKNTWRMAHAQTRAKGFVLKHTVSNVEAYRADVGKWLMDVAAGYAKQGQRLRAYSDKVMSPAAVARAVDEILFGEVKEKKSKTRQQQAKADAIIEMIEGRDGEFVPQGEVTAYSLFNAVTAYTMHRKPVRGELAQQTETRLWDVLTDDDITPRAFVVLDTL